MKRKHIFLTLIGSLILLSGCSAQPDENVVSETEFVPVVTTEDFERTIPTDTSNINPETTTTKATERETETTAIQTGQSSDDILNNDAMNEELQINAPSEFEEANPAIQNPEQPEGNSYTPPSGLEFDEDILIGTTSPENEDQNPQEELPDIEQPTVPDRVIELPFLPAQ